MSKELIAEMQAAISKAVDKAKCQYLQLAAAIMRECDQPGMADDIDQVRYSLARKAQDNQALADAVIKGVRHDAELLRKAEREVRIDECDYLLALLRAAEPAGVVASYRRGINHAISIALNHRRELEEQAEGRTDDE